MLAVGWLRCAALGQSHRCACLCIVAVCCACSAGEFLFPTSFMLTRSQERSREASPRAQSMPEKPTPPASPRPQSPQKSPPSSPRPTEKKTPPASPRPGAFPLVFGPFAPHPSLQRRPFLPAQRPSLDRLLLSLQRAHQTRQQVVLCQHSHRLMALASRPGPLLWSSTQGRCLEPRHHRPL
jgi:hypothetical protein